MDSAWAKCDDVGVGPRAVQEALGDAQVAVEHAQRQVRHLAGLVQVGPDAAVQVAARMRGRGLRPGGDDQRGGVARLQRQPPRHGRLGRADGGVAGAERGRAAVRQGFAQSALDAGGRQAGQHDERTFRIAQLHLRQRGLGTQVVALGLARDVGGGVVGGQRGGLAHGVQRLGAQPQGLGMVGLERQQRLEVAQRVAEGGQAHGLAGGGQQPGHRVAPVARFQPVAGDAGRRAVELGQARGDPPVHLQAAVGRHLLDQRLLHQVVAEAVAAAQRQQHAGGQRDVQRLQAGHLRLGRQRLDGGDVQFVAAQRQPLEQSSARCRARRTAAR